MHRRRRSLSLYALTTGLLLSAVSAPEVARGEDIFGRSGLYDATNSDLLKGYGLDDAYIRGEKPSFAEQKGLAGAPTVEVRRNFVYIQDSDGSLTIPYRSQTDLIRSFEFAMRELYRVEPDEFVFVYLFTSFRTGVGAFFYSPEANNTNGIGQPPFRRSSSAVREGFVFMNYWQSFEDQFGRAGQAFVRGQSRAVFNQEAAHRWCAYVQTGTTGAGRGHDVLRGRDDAHWSYFLHTGGSPMEGNDWRDNGNGTFTTVTTFNDWHYSDLDLYLMGLKATNEIQPFFVVSSPVIGNARDLRRMAVNRTSPPQVPELGGQVTIRGTRVDFTIQDIINRNGIRSPPAGQAPTRWRSVFVLLASQANPLNEAQRVQFEGKVDDYATGFKEGTGNRGQLDYALRATPKMPIGGSCMIPEQCDAMEAQVCLLVPPVQPGTGLCTRICPNNPCPMDWCCQAASTGVRVCLPPELCQPEAPPDAGVVPDAGVPAMMPDASAGTCACDTTTACEMNCPCDPDCMPKSGGGGGGGSLQSDRGGCACVLLSSSADRSGFASVGTLLILAGLALLGLPGGAKRWRKQRADRSDRA